MEDPVYTVQEFELDTDGLVKIHAFPYRSYKHPVYGDLTFTPEDAMEMKENFENKVLEHDVSWNYAHRKDAAKGDKAAGWVKRVEIEDDGLYVFMEPTATARDEIKKGEWRYSSMERLPEWTNSSTGKTFKNVLYGGALTNYPFLKGVAPLNFSDFDRKEEFDNDEGGKVDLKELAVSVGLPEDSDEATVKAKIQEFADVAAAKAKADAEKDDGKPAVTKTVEEEVKQEFGDLPEAVRNELIENRTFRRESNAQKFADEIKSEDGSALAPKYKDQVKSAYLKLETGEITMQAFASTMAEATSKGFVETGERGSSQNEKGNDDGNEKEAPELAEQFAEEFVALTTGENAVSREKALEQLKKEKPELVQAYSEITGGGV